MNNKLKKTAYISIIMIIVVLIACGKISFADTKSDLQAQQRSIDNQIAETNSEIAGVKSQMTTTLSQINRLNSQISSYEDEIGELETQMTVLNTQIDEKQNGIQEQEIKYQEQQELLNKRLIALYESGSTSYLDMLLSSDGLADFISKFYLISQLAEFDQDLLDDIERTRSQIQLEKEQLESTKSEVQNAKTTMEVKRNSLDVSVREKNALVNNLTEEEKALQEQLEEFEKDKKDIQARIAALAKKNNRTTATVAPSAAGYISPLSGRTKANITTGYYGYAGHTGVDFACSGGTPILAVKSGVVVTSMARKNSAGKYISYGEYIIIDHEDGTMTLYAHGSPGTRLVQEGQRVSQGQQIMSVGTTGNSTGYHLHFEVFVGGKRTNPTAYLP